MPFRIQAGLFPPSIASAGIVAPLQRLDWSGVPCWFGSTIVMSYGSVCATAARFFQTGLKRMSAAPNAGTTARPTDIRRKGGMRVVDDKGRLVERHLGHAGQPARRFEGKRRAGGDAAEHRA